MSDDPRTDAAAEALYEDGRDPAYTGKEWDWPNIDRSYDKPDDEWTTDPEWCRNEYRAQVRVVFAAADAWDAGAGWVRLQLNDELLAKLAAVIDEQYDNDQGGPIYSEAGDCIDSAAAQAVVAALRDRAGQPKEQR